MGCNLTKERLCITYDIWKTQFYVCKCIIDSSNYHIIINENIKNTSRYCGGYYGFYDFPIDIIIKEGIYTSNCLKNILLKEGYKEDNIKKLFKNLKDKVEIKN